MKTLTFLATTIGLIATMAACTTTDKSSAIDALNEGPSVFDTPTPTLYTYSDAKPGYNDRIAKSWDELPPLIPHRVEEFLPVNMEDNQRIWIGGDYG